jgi:hypothetical protein
VPAEVILDTGALVSLLDRGQTDHAACRTVYESLGGALVTTEAVVTEACHLLARAPGGAERCLEFLLEAGVAIAPATPGSIRRALVLVRKYRDTPMDYADASLVVLAEDLGCDRVFTVDRRGFSAYRLSGRRGFRIVP